MNMKLIKAMGAALFFLGIQSFMTTSHAQTCLSAHEVDSLLLQARIEDQTIRQKNMRLMAKSSEGFTMELVDSLVLVSEEMERIDTKNMNLVSSLLKKGWPEGLDKQSYGTIWLIIDHSDTKYQKKYFRLLEKAVEKGDVSMSDLATLKDRILLRSNKKQIYGTQSVRSISDSGEQTLYIWPVKNPEQLNQLRKEAGLPTIEEYIKVLGIKDVIYNPDLSIKEIKKLTKNKVTVSE